MDEETVKTYANLMLDEYDKMIVDHSKKYDVTEHNLCIAIVERSQTRGKVYWSYSNPSGLNAATQKRFDLENKLVPFISDPNVKLPDYAGDTRNNRHTEIRLLNYLYSIRELENNAFVTLISSRTICDRCWEAIVCTQADLAKKCALLGMECKAELPPHELQAWVANVAHAKDVWKTKTGRPIFPERKNGIRLT